MAIFQAGRRHHGDAGQLDYPIPAPVTDAASDQHIDVVERGGADNDEGAGKGETEYRQLDRSWATTKIPDKA